MEWLDGGAPTAQLRLDSDVRQGAVRSNTSFQSLLKIALTAASHCIVVCDATHENRIVYSNPAFSMLTGYEPAEIKGRNCRFLQGVETDPKAVASIGQAIAAGRSIRREILNYRKDGQTFWNDLTIDPIRNKSGVITGFVSGQFDCTEKRLALKGQFDAMQQLTAIADSVPGYIFRRRMRPTGEISYPYMSPSLYRILGVPLDAAWSPDQFVKHIHPDDRDRFIAAAVSSAAALTKCEVELRLFAPDGTLHWFRTVSSPVRCPDGDIVWDGVGVDITAEKAAALRLTYLAEHDALTGLSNRSAFNRSLVRAVTNLSPDGRQTAVYTIDLDDMQSINDTMGQAFGDAFLNTVAVRLSDLASSRGGMAARLGGDEFGVILPSLPGASSGLEMAEALCQELRRPVTIDSEQAVLEGCVGAAVFPRLSESSQAAAGEELARELVKRATLALQVAKRDGTGVCRLYAPELDDRLRDDAILRKSLQKAVIEEQFTLHYQPIVELGSGKIVGAEALLRWEHPELGLQLPDKFIPLAEASGLIVPLGAWALKAAMRQGAAWRKKGLPPIVVAVNVSSVQLQKPGYIAAVEQAIAETGADPRHFELELTETTLLEATAPVKAQLLALKALGFCLAIDDFGSGHATFKYLREFPADKIKIDRMFIRDLFKDSNDASIVRSMLYLSRSLNLATVAEGIETPQQVEFLLSEGCEIGQGYYYSLPMRAEDVEWLLKPSRPLPMSGIATEATSVRSCGE